ncbi:MAG: ABC transporter ATP-binding protein [Thermoprotei archaeon]|nr:MAG: ABC transporter ATP-binding protein [Thermoprotei archaeon]
MNLIEVKDLTKKFPLGRWTKRTLTAVDRVSFSIPEKPPKIITLAGESGSGKTTTARLILGFIKPTSGRVLWRGRDIWKLDKKGWKQYRKEVQAVFQDPYSAFNPLFKVDRVLTIPLKKFGLASTDEEAYEMACKALEIVGLRPEEVLGKYPHQLSGGERQRIMLARAFLLKPKLIIADEPVSMIDASLRASILNIMFDFKDKWGVSFLYITHDLSTAYYISDEIIIMYRGSIMEMGPVDDVIEDPMHPYVRLLIESIPIPDPSKRWMERIILPKVELSRVVEIKGCKFYDRCPKRMPMCAERMPKLIEVERGRRVACFLYHKEAF